MTVLDPLHNPGGPRTAWTVTNTAENFPGVVTPLSATFWLDTHERSLRQAFVEFGVLAPREVYGSNAPDDRFSAMCFGRWAANVDRMRYVSDRMPGTSGSETELQIFGSVRPDVVDEPSWRRYPLIAVRMPWAIRRLPAKLSRMRDEIVPWWQETTRPGALSDVDTAREVLRESMRRFEAVLVPHNCVSMWGSALYGQLSTLAAASGCPGLETALISGYGGMEETESIVDLWEVSRDRLALETFVQRHGYHAPVEAELRSVSWREDPVPLHARIEVYRGLGEDSAPGSLERRQRASRADAERRVLDGLPRHRRAGARMLLRMAARHIPLREVGKAAFVRVIDAGRAASRALGTHLAGDGVLRDPDDVYFLTVAEATGALPADPVATVAARRARFDEYASIEIPQSWVGVPEPITLQGRRSEKDEVTGIAVSPGVVEGVARTMTGPDSGELVDGEVLVCRTTDPSWASLFMVASAVVIDIGGPLSHGAIVSREFGIPCVIGTGDGTSVIRTGDRVRVDGGTGRVEVLSRA